MTVQHARRHYYRGETRKMSGNISTYRTRGRPVRAQYTGGRRAPGSRRLAISGGAARINGR